MSGSPNHERNTAAAPVKNALTLTMTDRPSSRNAAHVNIFLIMPEKSSESKHLIN